MTWTSPGDSLRRRLRPGEHGYFDFEGGADGGTVARNCIKPPIRCTVIRSFYSVGAHWPGFWVREIFGRDGRPTAHSRAERPSEADPRSGTGHVRFSCTILLGGCGLCDSDVRRAGRSSPHAHFGTAGRVPPGNPGFVRACYQRSGTKILGKGNSSSRK